MNHSDIQNRMADYLEGDLSLSKRALFDAHLDACTECARELSEMRGTSRGKLSASQYVGTMILTSIDMIWASYGFTDGSGATTKPQSPSICSSTSAPCMARKYPGRHTSTYPVASRQASEQNVKEP